MVSFHLTCSKYRYLGYMMDFVPNAAHGGGVIGWIQVGAQGEGRGRHAWILRFLPRLFPRSRQGCDAFCKTDKTGCLVEMEFEDEGSTTPSIALLVKRGQDARSHRPQTLLRFSSQPGQ